MEHIYKQRSKTEEYNEKYFTEMASELRPFQNEAENVLDSVEKIVEKVGPVPQDALERILKPPLSEVKDPYFLHLMKEVTVPSSAMGFRCVRTAINPHFRKIQENRVKRGILVPANVADMEGLETAVTQNETVFTVRVYEPFKYICASRRTPKVAQEIQLLGKQQLTVLRDNISCRIGPFLDVSDNPDQESSIDYVDSGFFFINDTFYNDTRNPACLDYSQVLLEWMQRKGSPCSPKTAVMEDICIKDLTFKLGFPYVFQHYGNCEHLILFSDVRLITRTELATLFPNMKSLTERVSYCYLCGLNDAVYVVVGSKDHVQDPSELCHQCMIMYHYIDGKKIGDFKAYKFGK